MLELIQDRFYERAPSYITELDHGRAMISVNH